MYLKKKIYTFLFTKGAPSLAINQRAGAARKSHIRESLQIRNKSIKPHPIIRMT